MSIALLRRNVKMKQEVNAWPPKEGRVEKEDADDHRREDYRTEVTGRTARVNKEETLESYTPAEPRCTKHAKHYRRLTDLDMALFKRTKAANPALTRGERAAATLVDTYILRLEDKLDATTCLLA
ncbi:hypothetical protein NDU88_003336 [Pleurodeles waltl]|uniref:Uncharacterized protein n=1 Tax=Pleurodeles waltl TaxID=8319 RepID=A0AAV7T4D6_PLEWA|nr:hypothetical protein NDU88_003336 [Pleurodeles waltl]